MAKAKAKAEVARVAEVAEAVSKAEAAAYRCYAYRHLSLDDSEFFLRRPANCGRCHRFPPTSDSSQHPLVNFKGRCGEFEARA